MDRAAYGTDVALMLGIAHTLVENSWQDDAFLTRCTSGYDIFARYLTGESDGVAKTADWAAAICAWKRIRSVNWRNFSMKYHHADVWLGMQRQQYGEQKHWMLVTLAAMLGQIGTPGGGFGLSYHFANGGNPTRRAAVLGSMQGSVAGGVDAVEKIPVARIVEALENPGAEYQHNGMAVASPIFAYLVGRRGQLYSSSGHQPPDSGLAEAGADRHLRMLLDRRRAPCRYRPAGDHLV
ncbi:biotin sulfoxide reductase [Klebsiella aerogenes]|nr:biotin sulfoxide reductase [Klebsiella aerogenes]